VEPSGFQVSVSVRMPDWTRPVSAQEKATVTVVLFQPLALAAGLGVPAIRGFVLSRLMPPAPLSQQLPAREWADVVAWQRDARLESTRRSLIDADDATALYAFRRWRDESGAVMREAYAGLELAAPACPVLCIASATDRDVPMPVTSALAMQWDASLLRVPSASHVGPLLARNAAVVATQALRWLSPR